MPGPVLSSIGQVIGAALDLGALEGARLTRAERALLSQATPVARAVTRELRGEMLRGDDPLGAAYLSLRSAAERRSSGATFTPEALVISMVNWVKRADPKRVVDPGAGSGRFIVAVGQVLDAAQLVAVELDPLCALMLRARLSVTGLAHRATVHVGDFTAMRLRRFPGKTAFIGNPPYVRHHLIHRERKDWYVSAAARLGIRASQLAGLHAHFVLATAVNAREGDVGCYVTAAEWLDVNYGSALRELFVEPLGLQSLRLVDPRAKPFPDADTTAVICCFQKGVFTPTVNVSRVSRLSASGIIGNGKPIARDKLSRTARWTSLTHSARKAPGGYVELGEICRVHRGQVTGQNQIWIVDRGTSPLPVRVLFPAVTRARELFSAGFAIHDTAAFRCVVDLPAELDALPRDELATVERFLRKARAAGADSNYIARHRKPWWSVGLREPAPILASYMARRPPAFVRNLASVRHVNVAHGLYPRVTLSDAALNRLTEYLRTSVSCSDGRTYCGGLTKFEPKEMERLLVPAPDFM